jgi:dTDP-glucose 4,6-dehydratase
MTSKVKRIVVTGGSGFIGNHICKMIAARHPKIEVISLSIESAHEQKQKDEFKARFNNISYVQADVLDKDSQSLSDALKDSDSVIHTVGALLDGGAFNYKDLIKDIETGQICRKNPF